jgi:hypothetical protein
VPAIRIGHHLEHAIGRRLDVDRNAETVIVFFHD